MNEKRFACPYCGQHYAVDASWREAAMACSGCGRNFWPGALVLPGSHTASEDGAESPLPQTEVPVSVAPPPIARPRITVRMVGKSRDLAGSSSGLFRYLAVEVLGLFTPIILVLCMGLGTLVLGGLTLGLGVVACPFIGYRVSSELCEHAYGSGGQPAFKRYVLSTLAGFVLWGAIFVAPLCFSGIVSEDETRVFFFVIPIGFGAGFLLWALAAGKSRV